MLPATNPPFLRLHASCQLIPLSSDFTLPAHLPSNTTYNGYHEPQQQQQLSPAFNSNQQQRFNNWMLPGTVPPPPPNSGPIPPPISKSQIRVLTALQQLDVTRYVRLALQRRACARRKLDNKLVNGVSGSGEGLRGSGEWKW